MPSAWCQSASHEPSKRVFRTSCSPVDLIASAPVLPCLTIIILAPPLPHLGLRPQWHAREQHRSQRPYVVGQSGRHRRRTGLPLLRGARPVGGLRNQQRLAYAGVAAQSYGTLGTIPVDGASRLRPGTAYSPGAPLLPPAGGCRG